MFQKMMARKNKKGFTILELLVVVAIIAVLAVIAVPQFLGAIEKSKVSAQIADLTAIDKAEVMYNFDHSAFTVDNVDTTDVDEAVTELEDGYINAFPAANKWDGTIELDNTATTAKVVMAGVPIDSAKAMEKAIDQTATPSNSDSTGRLQYEAADTDGKTSVTYVIKQ